MEKSYRKQSSNNDSLVTEMKNYKRIRQTIFNRMMKEKNGFIDYISEIKKRKPNILQLNEYAKHIFYGQHGDRFVSRPFSWSSTKKGYDYWEEVHLDWSVLLYRLNNVFLNEKQ